jgi:hypothetical protein
VKVFFLCDFSLVLHFQQGMKPPITTFRGGGGGQQQQLPPVQHESGRHYRDQQQEQAGGGGCCCSIGLPLYSIGGLGLIFGLVVPLTAHVNPIFGSVIGLIIFCLSLVLVWRFMSVVRAATMTDWDHVKMPGAFACLDVYLFVCLNWALVWFLLWATDKEGALLTPSAILTDSGQQQPYLVYIIILYSVLASFWFSGGGRLYPSSPAAYAWGFISLVLGAWFAIVVIGWVVHIVRRSPSRVNENTLLPVYHTPVPPPHAAFGPGPNNGTGYIPLQANRPPLASQPQANLGNGTVKQQQQGILTPEEARKKLALLMAMQETGPSLTSNSQQKSTKAKDI